MKRPTLEEWTRGRSFLHERNPKIKLILAALVLVWIGTSGAGPTELVAGYGPLLAVGVAASSLPPIGLARRALMVMTFTAAFSLVAWLGGDPERALRLLVKSSLSSITILLFVGTTPLPGIMGSLGDLGVPRLVTEVTLFVYRYLFVLAAKAATVRQAAACRGGFRWSAAGGAAASLFGSAYSRAEGIHRAMLSRGAARQAACLQTSRSGWADHACLVAVAAFLAGARLMWSL